MSEEEAYEKYKSIRWYETNGEPVCVACGCPACIEIKTRRTFKCKGCGRHFSATSETIFASRKLPYGRLLEAIALFVNGAKGHSALQLSREMDIQYKTAFVLLHKIREAVGTANDMDKLAGHIEIDGAYYGGYVKPANHKKNRRDLRLKKNQNGKRRVMVVMREVDGGTTCRIYREEWEATEDALKMASGNSMIYVDAAPGWGALHALTNVGVINHKQSYSTDMACTNWAESFHSRCRRSEIGIHHHIAGPYLRRYGLEMCWREDHRYISNGEQFDRMIKAVTHFPISKQWRGYWQRRKPRKFNLSPAA